VVRLFISSISGDELFRVPKVGLPGVQGGIPSLNLVVKKGRVGPRGLCLSRELYEHICHVANGKASVGHFTLECRALG